MGSGMNVNIGICLVGLMVVTSCSAWRDSGANPRNWFGGSRAVEVEEVTNPLLPRQANVFRRRAEEEDLSEPIEFIRSLEVERSSVGAIVRAEGVTSRLGAFGLELREDENPEDGVLSFSFRVIYPEGPTPVGSELARTVRAAASVSLQDLQSVRIIRVSGSQNARETRRR